MTKQAVKEFIAFKPSLGKVDISENRNNMRLAYREMSDVEVETHFNQFFSDYYKELEAAGNDFEKRLTAVARVIQNLQRLHCVRDGSGRTDTALLNQLLTEAGFHPVILKYPYFSTSKSLKEWVQYLAQGLIMWELMLFKIEGQSDEIEESEEFSLEG